MQKYLLTSLILFSAALVSGQGWEHVYGGGGSDEALGISQTPDGGYIMAGSYGSEKIYLIKTDADGAEQWSKVYGDANIVYAYASTVTHDTGYVAAGYYGATNNRDLYLFKADQYGNKLWAKRYGNTTPSISEEAYCVKELPNGELITVGKQKNYSTGETQAFVLKTDAAGNQMWLKYYGQTGSIEVGKSLTLTPDGGVVVAGEYQVSSFDHYRKIDIFKLEPADGSVLWDQKYSVVSGTTDDASNSIVTTSSGDFIIAGSSSTGVGGVGYMMKIDALGSGTPIWLKTYNEVDELKGVAINKQGQIVAAGTSESAISDLSIIRTDAAGNLQWYAKSRKSASAGANAVLAAKDGGAVAAGYAQYSVSGFGEQRVYLVKTDRQGTIFTSYIQGNVFWDNQTLNCQQDANEPSLRSWIIAIESSEDTIYAASNGSGSFSVAVDTGVYNLHLYNPSNLWLGCTPNLPVHVANFYDTTSVALPVRSTEQCPRNEVDLITPILRRCADNKYSVQYCNSGTAVSQNTYVKVILDPLLSVSSSSIPYTKVADTLTFNIGTVSPGQCDKFTFTALLDCNAPLKSAHCAIAHIYPDSFCVLGTWDKSIIQAVARCENDSVKFNVVNIGTGITTDPIGYVIVEEIVLLTPPNDPSYRIDHLEPNKERFVWGHEATGKTYRMILDGQTSGYPGNSIPTASIEGCLSDTATTTPSYGFYTMFPDDDAEPFVSSDCQEVSETDYNPITLKRGHPKGYDVAHYVSPKTDLDYLIHFQNTGADVVQQVIVRDTLSAALDPATVHPGAASHPYQFQVYGNGIVEFYLPTANLVPGSSADEGFISFRVSQKPNLSCGTEIFNSAAIYFDFGAPTQTDTTLHTVCDSLHLVLGTKEIQWQGADLRIYPNPFAESAQVEINGVQSSSYEFALYDIQGRLLSNQVYSQPTFRLYRHQIPAGIIFYRLTANGKPVATGKLIAQ